MGVADLTAGFVVSVDNGQPGERNSIRVDRPDDTGRIVVTVKAVEPLAASGKPMSAGDLLPLSPAVRSHLDAALASARRAVGVAVEAIQGAAA